MHTGWRSRWNLLIFPVSVLFLALAPLPGPARASDIRGSVEAGLMSLTGHVTNRTYYDGGKSVLRWPLDALAPYLKMGVSWHDIIEARVCLAAEPWGTAEGVMKDSDYLDEADFNRTSHQGLDIFSETALDAKTLVMSVDADAYPLRTRFVRAGVTAGYRYEEHDYRGYNTRQTGYGPWADQTKTIVGPGTLYTAEYDMYSAGVVLDASVPGSVRFRFEASALASVKGSDEDEHLRRNRVTFSSTSGHGYRTALAASFRIQDAWAVTSSFSYTKIATDGHQVQYWYGDDPATPGSNDTGFRLTGVRTDLDETCSSFSIGALRAF